MNLSDEDRRRIEKEEATRLGLKTSGFTELVYASARFQPSAVWTPDNQAQAQYRKLTFERLEREALELEQLDPIRRFDRRRLAAQPLTYDEERALHEMKVAHANQKPTPFFTWAGLGMLLIAAFVYIAIPEFVLWVLFELFGVK
jgi:hypothetical protein